MYLYSITKELNLEIMTKFFKGVYRALILLLLFSIVIYNADGTIPPWVGVTMFFTCLIVGSFSVTDND